MKNLTKKIVVSGLALSLGITSIAAISRSKQVTQYEIEQVDAKMGKLEATLGIVGILVSTATLIYNIVQTCTSDTADKIQNMIQILNSINQTVDSINNKLDDISYQLSREFSNVKIQFNELKIQGDLEGINKFDSMAYQKYETQLKSCVNKSFLDFGEPNSYSYLENYVIEQGYFFDNLRNIGEDVVISGEDVENAVILANNEMPITIDNVYQWIMVVGEKLISIINDQGKASSTHLDDVLTKRRNQGFDDDNFVDAFSTGFRNYLVEQFAIKVFKSGNAYQTYAADVVNSFKQYCNQLNNLSSPLILQYDIYENIFCFQKDSNYINNLGEERNLFVDTGYLYLNNFLQFANYAEQVAYLSGIIGSNTISDLENTILSTYNFLVNTIQAHYKVDLDGNPVDSYCYSTKCPIEVVKNKIRTETPSTFQIEKTSGKIDLQDDLSGGASFGKLIVDEERPEYRLTANELTYLSIVEGQMPILVGDSRPKFKDYLVDVLNTSIDTNVVVKFNEACSVADEKGYIYNAYSFGDPTNSDMKGGMFYKNHPEGYEDTQIVMGDTGYNGKYEVKPENLHNMTEIRGDYFNFDANRILYDESLYSYGFYYKGQKNWDDIGYFSSSYIVGQENPVSLFNTSSSDSLNVGTYVFKDRAASMQITSIDPDDDDVKIHTVTTDVDVDSLVKVEMQYGKYQLNDSPFLNIFSQEDKKDIDYKNTHLGFDNMVPYKDPNSDGSYSVIFDKFANDTDYAKYCNFFESEANLTELNKQTTNWINKFNASFINLNDGVKYFDSGIEGQQLTDIVNTIVKYLDVVSSTGGNVGGYIKPPKDASEFQILVEVLPQLCEILTNEGGTVKSKFVNNYIVSPVLSYVTGGGRVYCSLPSVIGSYLPIDELNINLPIDVASSSVKQAVDVEYSENPSSVGVDSVKFGSMVKTDKSAPYISQPIPTLGVYTLTGLSEGLNVLYRVVPGEEPTCEEHGFKTAYYDTNNNKYYSKPNSSSEIGDATAYGIWKNVGGEGYLAPTDIHNYECVSSSYDEQTNKFTINFECSECGEPASTTVNGLFVVDTKATCEEACKGHYYANGEFENTKYYVSTPINSYSKDVPSGHDVEHLIYHKASSNSCTVDGSKEYYECPLCGKKFKDEYGLEPFDGETVIPATHHKDKVHVPAKAATTEEKGNIEYWYCPDCGYYFLDEECTKRTALELVTIGELQYTFEYHERVNPTHYTAGHRAYYVRNDGKFFSDGAGINEIEDIEEWISETGDGYIEKATCRFEGPISYVVNGDKCTASRQCTYPACTELESETVTAIYVIDTDATCTQNALGHIEAIFENEEFGTYVTPKNSFEFTDSALGHEFENPTIEWDEKICTISGVCNHCEKSITLSKEGKLVIEEYATCNSNSIGHYEVVFNIGEIGVIKSESFEIPHTKIDHEYGNFQASWNDNVCVLTGKCTHDGCEKTITLNKMGTLVIDTPATCTENAKGHYVAVFDIEGVAVQKTAENSVTVANSALGHHYENGECTVCHEKDPNNATQNYINELDAKNSKLTALVIVFASIGGLALVGCLGLGIYSLKGKKKKID